MFYENRKSRGKGKTIKGCQKARTIVLFPDGSFSTRRHMCSCTNCKNGHFLKCTFDTNQIETDVENEELSFLDELENVSEEMISIVEVGSFVGIHKYSSTKL